MIKLGLLLDMKTILITLVVGHIFTVILISSYWRNHSRDSTMNTFFLAKCIQAVAWLLLTLRGGIPDLFTISIANSFLFIGSCLEMVAVLKLIGHFHPFTKKLYISLLTFCIVGFHSILLFYNYEFIRIFFASIGTALFVCLPVYRLFTVKDSTLLMKLMGFLYFLVSLSLIGRGIAALEVKQEMGLFTPGLIQTLSFFSLYLVMILGNTGFILILKEKADAELIHMAYYDELTQTLNRRTFVARTKQEMVRCVKEGEFLSYILFDIDYFKKFNDLYGHDAGDRILQNLSQMINQFLSPQHLFGRYGGDEFAILLTGLTPNESVKLLEQIMEKISLAEVEGVPEKYSISIGIITLIPDKQTKLETLYVCCDKALYEAKHNGRNCICHGKYIQDIAL